MKAMGSAVVLLLVSGLLSPSAACERPCEELETGTQEFGIWGGYSPGSTQTIGTAADRRFALVGLRYGFVFANARNVAIEYTADLIPLAVVFQSNVYRIHLTPTVSREVREGTVVAFGFAPIGFQFTARRTSRVQPFWGTSGGMLRSRIPVPVNLAEATRWNFTFDFYGGVQLMNENGKAVRFGYRFHHLSNANRSAVNPGMDSHIIFAGFSFHR
jgi:hypothetical protein